jgi:hypothetical protein
MAAIQLIDFEDIYTAIIELLKIQSTDTATLSRIKRDINIAYEDIISRHEWWWNRSLTTQQLPVKVITGTISVTEDSAAIVFSSAPAISLAGYRFKVSGKPDVYTISAHIAASPNATLSVTYVGATNATANFRSWKDYVLLPTDCKEVVVAQHPHYPDPLEEVGLEDFRRLVAQNPDQEGPPLYYTTDDFDAAGKRKLRYWPAVYGSKINLDVDYTMNFVGLDLAGDEPCIPIADRTVLFYYGASHAWERERNPEASAKYFNLGEKKLGEMAAKISRATGSPVLRPGVGYMAQKRQQRRSRSGF